MKDLTIFECNFSPIISFEKYMRLSPSNVEGLGVKCLRDILPETFIVQYTGELIDETLWKTRKQEYELSNNFYVFELRCTPKLYVDATFYGNIARFINHSCDPNVIAESVVQNGLPKIYLYAIKKIVFDDEFFIDYSQVKNR